MVFVSPRAFSSLHFYFFSFLNLVFGACGVEQNFLKILRGTRVPPDGRLEIF